MHSLSDWTIFNASLQKDMAPLPYELVFFQAVIMMELASFLVK